MLSVDVLQLCATWLVASWYSSRNRNYSIQSTLFNRALSSGLSNGIYSICSPIKPTKYSIQYALSNPRSNMLDDIKYRQRDIVHKSKLFDFHAKVIFNLVVVAIVTASFARKFELFLRRQRMALK